MNNTDLIINNDVRLRMAVKNKISDGTASMFAGF